MNEWLHTMDSEGLTPLDRAFNSGHMAIAEMMLRQEKSDQSESLKGSTPLHRAAYLGLTEAVKSLLRCGGTVANTRDYQGELPLHKAVRQGHSEVVSLLLSRSDVNAQNNEGMTPLHWACLTGRTEIARLLLTHDGDSNLRNEVIDGLSPAELAAGMGYDDLVSFLGAREVFA
jgi:uncharacterized protein